MRKVGYLLVLLTSLFYSRATYAQTLLRGQIIKAGSSVLDPNNDGFVSQTNAGFSTTTNYWVPEFEIKMFGVPILGSGDVTGDNTGKSCGITDLIPDTKGFSVYAVKDAANNLIFRFRVGDNNPSVEAWTILLDTDGLFGANDPNATAENPGFEVDISLIKNSNFGVIVYNIDGLSNCSTPLLTYSLDTHFQISVADEASCGDPDYFYDFYVPVADLTSALGVNLTTGVRIAAATNVSATCAMGGNIADISGVNNDDAAYKNCDACAFSALIGAQCPTEIINLCSTCSGFNSVPVNAPTINQPVRAGQTSVSGTSDDGIYIVVQIFPVIVGTTNQWSTTPREVQAAYATGTNWIVQLTGALQNYDKIVATAQKDQNTPPCGLNGDSQSSTSVTVALPNAPPVAQDQTVSVVEDTPTAINLVASDPDSDPLTYIIGNAPTHGTLSGSGSSVTYTPTANYNGSDSFTFKVSDGIFTSNTATITINVTPVNDPPVANSQSVTTLEDTSVGITLTGSDIEGSPLTYIVVTQPQHGSLTGSGASLTYTPAANYNGVDNFTFKVNDGTVDSNSNATVLITVNPVNDAPVANNQAVLVIEDTPTPITLSASDADGDPITYIVLTQPAHGTLSGTAPNLTYTPTLNYNGGDSFTFKVNDGTVDSNTATVTITVTPVNDAPIANNQSVIVTEDIAKAITLTATDVDANALTYTVVTPPTHGTLSGSAPNLTYTPAANYNGSDSFTFKANDGTVDSNIATVSITVTPVNDAPVANDQTVSTPEDTQLGITLTGSDVDGNTLTYIVVTPPTHGTLSGSAPNLTYTPAANYNGGDSFTFKVNDGTTDSNIATVTITVTPVNDVPVANDQTVTVTEDVAKAITLTATDVDGNALTYTVVSPPTHGTLSGSAPGLTYTPAANYNGNDSFTFKANDGTTDSNIATVSITVSPVNDAPVANDQTVTTVEDTQVPITLTASDPEGDVLTYIIVVPPAHGTLSGSAPNFTYTPDPNYSGSDSFTFKANDGSADSNTATVSITITPVNDIPIANNQSVIYDLNTPKAIVLTGSDADGNTLTYSIVTGPTHGTLDTNTGQNIIYTPGAGYNGADQFTFKVNDGSVDSNIATVFLNFNTGANNAPTSFNQSISTNQDVPVSFVIIASDPDNNTLTYIVGTPSHGTLSGAAPNLTYTPALNYTGGDSFTFKVNDGIIDSNIATVTITVLSVDHPPVANSQSISVTEDIAKPITLTATDQDGNTLIYSVVAPPIHGVLSGSIPNLTYTPSANYNGNDSFTFKANDGSNDSNIATISITITPVNDAPTTTGQTIIIDEDNSVSVVLTGNDVDGDPLTYIIVTPPAHGTLTGTGSTLTYTPAANYNGSDSFTFQVSDGTVNSNISTVNITINPINDVPTANNQSGANNQTVTTLEDTPVSIALTASDVDNDPLTFAIVTPPAHGTLSGSAPNVTYTPAADYTGSDAFTFKVNDGQVDSNIATVSINVTPVNDPPVANNQSIITLEDTQAAITLSASDVDGNALTYILVTSPAHGTLNGTAQSFTYTPAANYSGSDNFTFKVNDGTVDSNTATVSITVTSVDDSPIANSQSLSTVEDTSLGMTLTGSDIDSNSLTYSIVSPPGHGTITGSLPNITFVPTADYSGSDNFTFKINDGNSDSNIATIFISITPVNDAPVASSQNLVTNEDTQLNILLTGTDADANAITFNVTSQPSHGTLSGSAPSFTYTPGLNFNGSDSFTFSVNDGSLNSNTATISIQVNAINDAPIANDQSIALDEDTSASIILTATDVETNTLTYTLVTPPTNGTLTGSPPNLIYKPNLNYFGIDGFTFYVNDGTTNSNTATISITINPVNDAPTSSGQTATVDEDNSISLALTGNDVDGDPLTYIIVTPPAHGALTGSGANLTYTPDPNYNGSDGFSFEVNDGTINSNVSPISIVVNPINDVPTANNQSGANNQTVTTLEDTPVNIILTATDVDNDPLTYSISSQPTNGTLSGTPPNVLYTPDANYNGSDSFTFMANDGHSDSNIATVSINVTPVNDPPSVSPIPIIYTLEDNRRLVCLSVSDVDSQVITFTSPGNLLGGGSMTKDATFDFCYDFDPAANYNGRSTWTMGACDDAIPTACASINVEIRITPVNDPPVAIDDIIPKITARADTTIDVLANDLVIAAPDKEFYDIYEADSTDVLTIDKVTAYNGTATITNNGKTILYQSDFDFEGVDSIRYRIHDSGKLKDSALVVFDVSLRFHIYHGLSPNGDGKNDYWRIDKIDEYPGNTVRIFDRFNNLVFETHNYSNEKNNWTGQSNHGLATGLLPEDTYFYSVNLGGDKGTYSGYVVLKRH